MASTKVLRRPISEFPFYWFALWEQAIVRGDSVESANAARELERLGVRVSQIQELAAEGHKGELAHA